LIVPTIFLSTLKKNNHVLLKNNNINKKLRRPLDNNLTFKLYNRSIHFNIKTNSTLLKLVNEHLISPTCVRPVLGKLLLKSNEITLLVTSNIVI